MARYYIKPLQGLTLVELLVSLVLGALLFIMMMNVFLFTKKMLLTQQGITRMQMNARTIDYLLGKAIRNSGVFGCQRLSTGMNDQPLKGITYQDIPTALRANRKVMKRIIPESDILWLQASLKNYPLATYAQTLAQLKSGTIVVLTDCQKMAAFTVKPGMTIDTQGYAATATLNVLSSTVYYVAQSSRKNAQGNPILALYSTDFNGRTIELVEGVEELQLTYGQWVQGKLEYLPAHAVQNWQQVISVRLQALLNTVETHEPMMQKWWYFEWPLLIVN